MCDMKTHRAKDKAIRTEFPDRFYLETRLRQRNKTAEAKKKKKEEDKRRWTRESNNQRRKDRDDRRKEEA